jgi:hypothetical protein
MRRTSCFIPFGSSVVTFIFLATIQGIMMTNTSGSTTPPPADTAHPHDPNPRYARCRRTEAGKPTGKEVIIDLQTGKAVSANDKDTLSNVVEAHRQFREEEKFDIGRVFREKKDEFIDEYSRKYGQIPVEHLRVLEKIAQCRMVPIDNRVELCKNPRCGSYHRRMRSCGCRSCPKCQGLARKRWYSKRVEEIRPGTPYITLTFKLPPELDRIAIQNKQAVYGALIRSAAAALKKVIRKNLDIDKTGFVIVFQSWARDLFLHPHVHIVMPMGGFSKGTWKEIPEVRSISKNELREEFRRVFLKMIEKEYRAGPSNDEQMGKGRRRPRNRRLVGMKFYGELKHLSEGENFKELLDTIPVTAWHVFSDKIHQVTGTGGMLGYLARTISSGPIAGGRLAEYSGETVKVPVCTGIGEADVKTVTLDTMVFIQRFLLHVLPSGFWRSRAFGFLAIRNRQKWIERWKSGSGEDEGVGVGVQKSQRGGGEERKEGLPCPRCRCGNLVTAFTIEPCGEGGGKG